jgi:hypothetical protein
MTMVYVIFTEARLINSFHELFLIWDARERGGNAQY